MRAMTLLTALTCLALVLLSAERAEAFRCGSRLVSEGDSKAEVLAKCGRPTRTEAWTEEQVIKTEEGERRITIRYERWTYDRGPRTLIRLLTFKNDILIEIKTGGYGKSPT